MSIENIKLNFLILCDNASFDEKGRLNITGTFDTINTLGFPALHKKMSIVVNIDVMEGRYIEILKIKKEDKVIATTPETEIEKRSRGKHQFIHNFTNIIFPEKGDYDIEVYINGDLIGTNKLLLQQIQ